MVNATLYEVVNKETGEAYPVTKMEFFSVETGRVDVSFNGETETFTSHSGILENEFFSIREIGTHNRTDGSPEESIE